MRKLTMLATAGALLAAAALTTGPTQAMTLGAPAAVNGAAATLDPVDHVACWRRGWRGWGWYPCGPRWGYGWGGPRRYWGWRRGWHRW